jgi:Bacterial Ig-like domain (group 2)
MLRQSSLGRLSNRNLLAVVCVISMASLSCGTGKGGSGSGSSGGMLIGPAITTVSPLDSVTDPQALAFLVLGGNAGNCFPGGTVVFSSYETFQNDAVQGVTAKPVSSSSLTWTSSNPTIATVNNNGLVTCVADGMTLVNAALPNASPAVGVVFVGSAKHTLSLTPATGVFKVGDAVNFTVVLNTQFPDGTSTTQDVSSAITIDQIDTGGSGGVLALGASNNQYKAAKAGTAWGIALYHVPNPDFALSNVFSITVQ